ncbi:MAG: NADH-quinone oxidoreductase subunit L [Caldimonas sp.]
MNISAIHPGSFAALLAGLPLLYVLVSTYAASTRGPVAVAWRAARWGSSACLVLALVSLALLVAIRPVVVAHAPVSIFGTVTPIVGLRLDPLSGIVMALVAFVGWVIVRYSQPYLAGEARQRTYIAWLFATLAAVSIVILTDHLLVLALAWTMTSVSLHHLLTFYADRPAALIAAHKKFLCSRLAELCLFSAVILIGTSLGTLEIGPLLARATALETVPVNLQTATVLLAATALLKCAQLPFHGWLIQVMEAPTPVSALLHAGVVNLGGFVLIRLAPLLSTVPLAQAILVCFGTATAVLAALVMTTRISVKVHLAWSTCAQMGFMLMQCGLGAYDLALLHLVAHSLYKAHAFLAAGGAVRRSSIRQLASEGSPDSIGRTLSGAAIGAAMVVVAGWLWGIQPARQPALWALAFIVSLALTPLVSASAAGKGTRWLPARIGMSFVIAFAYFGLHALFGRWAPSPGQPAMWLWIFVLGGFALLFVLQVAINSYPRGRLARTIYPWFYAGLFLDDHFSRTAFALWPLRRRRLGDSADRPDGRSITTTPSIAP